MVVYYLIIFKTVCKNHSLTLAATTLFIAQPSMSQVIAELEKDYRVRL